MIIFVPPLPPPRSFMTYFLTDRNIINGISATLPSVMDDPKTNAIVIRGSGGKAFCAGGDIKALYGPGQQVRAASACICVARCSFVFAWLSFTAFAILMHWQVPGKPSSQMLFFKSEYLVDLSLALSSKPVVSLIDGTHLFLRTLISRAHFIRHHDGRRCWHKHSWLFSSRH
jgi:enoyl-CoA hydratase/carnithine racemase